MFKSSSKTEKIKYGVQFWEELKGATLTVNEYEFKIDELPLKVEYLSNNQFDSYVLLTGFFLLEEAKQVINEKWEEIKGTLDCDP